MAVTDDYLKPDDDITFDYLILIQHTTTGNIGAIDPKIRSGINGRQDGCRSSELREMHWTACLKRVDDRFKQAP